MSVTLGAGWVNDSAGERTPVWSGEFHYFRNDRKHWPRILKAMRDAGLTVVTSFVQPNYHEYEPGKFDFVGRTVPERDLPHLLMLAKEVGLYVQLRLGPACCEWRESGGTSFGTDWHDISNAFWDAVGPYQADRGGSLLLYQVHNEWVHPLGIYYIILPAIAGFDGFHAPSPHLWAELVGPNAHYIAAGYDFSIDYFPDYLASLYQDAGSLNAAWGTDYASFDAVRDELAEAGVDTMHKYILYCRDTLRHAPYPGSSPRRAVDMLNWANVFKAVQLAKEVDHTRTRASIPILHNWAMGDERKWSAMTHMDLCGYDMYAPMSVDIWQWNKNTYDMQTSPFPFSNEFMCGTIERYEWGGQGFYTDNFARMSILSYIMGGMKGVNLYMFVERDNWLQCPIDERGGKRSVYYTISSMVTALRRVKWHEASMARDLGVFKNPDYHRYTDGSDDGMFDEGHRDDYVRDGLYQGHCAKQQFVAAFRALHDRSVDFGVFKDTRGGESLDGYRTVLAYSLWFMDQQSARNLLDYVESGGSLVLYPCVPTHSDDGSPMDLFTGRLGLQPFAEVQSLESHLPIEEIDLDMALGQESCSGRTADGRLVAQVRKYGKGRVLALNTLLADHPEALERVVTEWGGCRKFASTPLALTDGGMAIHEDGYGVVVAVNGTQDKSLSEMEIDVTPLPEADAYSVTDELSETLIGSFGPVGGRIRVPIGLGPRDGTLMKVAPGASRAQSAAKVQPRASEISRWRARWEDDAEYRRRYLGPDVHGWVRVPLDDWTLPAIASGKTFGVQGWFYLKQNVDLPECDGPVYLHVRPKGYHNLGIVYVNGIEVGRFGVERPGAEFLLDATSAARKGTNTLAVRLYRQSLDCHDRGLSGSELLRFECGANVVSVEDLYLTQERRDYGEAAGWARSEATDEWNPVDLPLAMTMKREGDALWLRTEVEVDSPEGALLRLEGHNCVVSVFANGEYVVKSPMLPCDLPVGEMLRPGTNTLTLRVTPDNFENYLVPRDRRYETYIRDGFLPLEVRLEKVEIRTR